MKEYQNSEAVLSDISLPVPKSSGSKMNLPTNTSVTAHVMILAGITQLITVVLSDKINHHEFIRSLKPLIA